MYMIYYMSRLFLPKTHYKSGALTTKPVCGTIEEQRYKLNLDNLFLPGIII